VPGEGVLVAGELDGAAALGFHGLAQAALGEQGDPATPLITRMAVRARMG
jgi:hypothetical protein